MIPPIREPDEDPAELATSAAEIRLAAMNLLARREHSVHELRTKLRRRFADEAMLEDQLSRLAAQQLQSDVRFAESYARQRIGRGYGPLRLREELRERGVSAADIAATLEQMHVDWRAIALDVLQKKFGATTASSLKEQARRARFMQARGFSSEHYRRQQHD